MSWHYRIQKKWTIYKGKKYPFYCIVEYYRRSAKSGTGWTRDPIWPSGDKPSEVIKVLEMMLKDAKKYRPNKDDSPWKVLLNEDEWRLSSKAMKGGSQ